jgi:hypothetical protein
MVVIKVLKIVENLEIIKKKQNVKYENTNANQRYTRSTTIIKKY